MRYWLLKDRKSEGPFTPEALVALPGYDRGWLICPEDKPSSERSNWTPAWKHPDIVAAIKAPEPLPFGAPPPSLSPPPAPGPSRPEMPAFTLPSAQPEPTMQAPQANPLMTPVPTPAGEAATGAPAAPPMPRERHERLTRTLVILLGVIGVLGAGAALYVVTMRTRSRADEVPRSPTGAQFPKDDSPPPPVTRAADAASPPMKEPASIGGRGGPLDPSR